MGSGDIKHGTFSSHTIYCWQLRVWAEEIIVKCVRDRSVVCTSRVGRDGEPNTQLITPALIGRERLEARDSHDGVLCIQAELSYHLRHLLVPGNRRPHLTADTSTTPPIWPTCSQQFTWNHRRQIRHIAVVGGQVVPWDVLRARLAHSYPGNRLSPENGEQRATATECASCERREQRAGAALLRLEKLIKHDTFYLVFLNLAW